MRFHNIGVILLFPLATLVTGCASFISSKPASSGADGIEYALCQPILVANPQVDGTVKFEVSCVADPTRRYVVSGYTIFGNLTLNVALESDMTLSGLTIDPNTAAVAAETIKAAGEIKKKKIEVKTAAATKQADTETAALKKTKEEEKAALDTAKANLTTAKTALDTAEATRDAVYTALEHEVYKLNSLMELYGFSDMEAEQVIADTSLDVVPRTAISAALILVNEKQGKYQLADTSYQKASEEYDRVASEAAGLAVSGNVPNAASGNSTAGAAGKPQNGVWGPQIYRIEQNVASDTGQLDVKLIAMFEQPKFDTIEVKKPSQTDVSAKLIDKATLENGNIKLTIKFTEPVEGVDLEKISLFHIASAASKVILNPKFDTEKQLVEFTISKGLPRGNYLIKLEVFIDGEIKDIEPFTVNIPPA